MTQREKIELLKETIEFLYEKEGRSKNYISNLLKVDRKVLTATIELWGLTQGNSSRLTPSNEKFLNKHRKFIIDRLNSDVAITDIARELGVSRDKINKLIPKDKELTKARDEKQHRSAARKQEKENKKPILYTREQLCGEEWCEILGYDGYEVSNKGTVISYKGNGKYQKLTPYPNVRSGYHYVKVKEKNFALHRLVANAFVEGRSEEKNTVNHIDGNKNNNYAENLEWVSQSDNNKKAYELGRTANIAFANNKKPKYYSLAFDGKEFEFKTVAAMSKFLKLSETQVRRQLSDECENKHSIKIHY